MRLLRRALSPLFLLILLWPTVTWSATTPPTFSISADPATGGKVISLDATPITRYYAGRGVALVSYQWGYGDGSLRTYSRTGQHSYANSGTYEVVFRAWDLRRNVYEFRHRLRIHHRHPTPLPSKTPTPSATQQPTRYPSATPAPSTLPTPSVTRYPTGYPTATPIPSKTPTATGTPVPTRAATPTAASTPVPTSTATPTATNTPVPTSTATPTATNTPVPTSTATPTATGTPVPTSTPTPTPTDSPTVTPAPGQRGNLVVLVTDANGALIPGAEISIDGKTANSDGKGLASLIDLPVGAEQLVTVRLPGFITQVLRVSISDGTTSRLPVRLKGTGRPEPILSIETGRSVTSPVLNAKVSFPDNAFVTADGQPATGKATLFFTPWDVTQADLNAMLGDGQTPDGAGGFASLISAGMLTLEFIDDATGSRLQLAPGKKATISMDLPFTSLNGTPLAAGSTIPLWYFDESTGLWVEEGTGIVVAAGTSLSGLAVQAEVAHFSTWNWDIKFNNAGSVNVSCVDSNGPVECLLSAAVTLPDGSRFTRSGSAPAGGITVINMPTQADITWTATTQAGQQGTVTQAIAEGPVVITLTDPKTSNFVRCQADPAIPALFSNCEVDATFTLADGSGSISQHYVIPQQGATIKTLFDVSGIQWFGAAINRANGTLATLLSSVPARSGTAGDVDILLNESTPIAAVQIARFVCPTTLPNIISGALLSCDMRIVYIDRFERANVLFEGQVATGQPIPVAIPAEVFDPDVIGFSVDAFYSQIGQFRSNSQFAIDVSARRVLDGRIYVIDESLPTLF